MALSIKDERADRLVRRYAKLHNTTYTGAIIQTFSEALRREGVAEDDASEEKAADFLAYVRDMQKRVAMLPVLDPQSADDLLYDEDGLPK
jgi:hypothetical protein